MSLTQLTPQPASLTLSLQPLPCPQTPPHLLFLDMQIRSHLLNVLVSLLDPLFQLPTVT